MPRLSTNIQLYYAGERQLFLCFQVIRTAFLTELDSDQYDLMCTRMTGTQKG